MAVADLLTDGVRRRGGGGLLRSILQQRAYHLEDARGCRALTGRHVQQLVLRRELLEARWMHAALEQI